MSINTSSKFQHQQQYSCPGHVSINTSSSIAALATCPSTPAAPTPAAALPWPYAHQHQQQVSTPAAASLPWPHVYQHQCVCMCLCHRCPGPHAHHPTSSKLLHLVCSFAVNLGTPKPRPNPNQKLTKLLHDLHLGSDLQQVPWCACASRR
eukprot:1150342-Pelagomonas_calceolata.AAC.11